MVRIAWLLGVTIVLGNAQGPLPLRVRPARRADNDAGFRVAVKHVVIPVTATDPVGKPVRGLPSRAFHLFEDGVEQKLSYFADDDAPVSVGILFDASGSMTKKLRDARAAVAAFLRAGMPGDEYMLIAFQARPRVLSEFSSEPAEVEKRLTAIQPDGWTAVFDAVYLGVSRMKHSKNPRRARLLISDGGDNKSRYSRGETINMIREADTAIYAIGLSPSGLAPDCAELLSTLAGESGGVMLPVRELHDLPDAISKINGLLRHRYLLGYEPANEAEDGKYRNISVKLDRLASYPPIHLYWRPGYYAPYGW